MSVRGADKPTQEIPASTLQGPSGPTANGVSPSLKPSDPAMTSSTNSNEQDIDIRREQDLLRGVVEEEETETAQSGTESAMTRASQPILSENGKMLVRTTEDLNRLVARMGSRRPKARPNIAFTTLDSESQPSVITGAREYLKQATASKDRGGFKPTLLDQYAQPPPWSRRYIRDFSKGVETIDLTDDSQSVSPIPSSSEASKTANPSCPTKNEHEPQESSGNGGQPVVPQHEVEVVQPQPLIPVSRTKYRNMQYQKYPPPYQPFPALPSRPAPQPQRPPLQQPQLSLRPHVPQHLPTTSQKALHTHLTALSQLRDNVAHLDEAIQHLQSRRTQGWLAIEAEEEKLRYVQGRLQWGVGSSLQSGGCGWPRA
ncbi:hypothetical protein BDV96DRAFT_564676 [Lophiotrema nucula]|uniref:Uncharacterized protein n=1 Tax=Lophiotrema nucula TaxID=690887 RepID=A0A6A5ZS10_9PLEO|nr:hypothetical protein BDV96DRAFT_564676 [Lophiotrema nucula]